VATGIRHTTSLEKLKTPDIVLLNEELLLLSFTDDNHFIKYSYLTYDDEKISIAKDYFKSLLKDAESSKTK